MPLQSSSPPSKARPRFLLRGLLRRRLAAMRRPLRLAVLILATLTFFSLVLRPAIRAARYAADARREAAILRLHAKGAVPAADVPDADAVDPVDHPPAHNFEAAVADAPKEPPPLPPSDRDSDTDSAAIPAANASAANHNAAADDRARPPILDDDRSVDSRDLVPAVPSRRVAPTQPLPPISAVVLFHNEYPTLNHTLESWEQHDFPSTVSELVFFLNGVSNTSAFHSTLPRLANAPWRGLTRVVNSPENLPLGLAIVRMVRLAKSDLVLLLEKDWALIEPRHSLRSQLSVAARLVLDDSAHVVRFRHRERPGAPLHARIMHQGREKQLLRQQSNLFCYVHHWLPDPPAEYPDYIERCPGTSALNDTRDAVWCSKARYCQWTNNPGLFRKSWFLDNIGGRFESDYNTTKKQNPQDAMLDFEFYANWRMDVWNDRNYTIALPRGLFEHQEVGEQNLMNTVWYAWNRLSTDVREKRDALLSGERRDCESRNKTLDSGLTYKEKFPLDFVHLYHYERAMKRPLHEAVRDLLADSRRVSNQIAPSGGSWRSGVTDLTNLWYTTCLYSYPVEPVDMSLAFVTMLYSASPGEDDTVSDEAVAQFAANAHVFRKYPLVLYTTTATAGRVRAALMEKHRWTEHQATSLQVLEQTREEMLSKMLGEKIMEGVDAVIGEAAWRERVTNRSSNAAPERAGVLLSLVTPYLLRDTVLRSQEKLESTESAALRDVTHFVWFDADSPCVSHAAGKGEEGSDGNPDGALEVGNDAVFRAHMLLNTMVTGRTVSSKEELESALGARSGFSNKVLLGETGVDDIGSSRLRVVDGGIMGGSHLAIVLSVGYYDVVLRSTIHSGEVGTRSEPLTIAMRNVDYNFEMFEEGGENNACELFKWTGRCALFPEAAEQP